MSAVERTSEGSTLTDTVEKRIKIRDAALDLYEACRDALGTITHEPAMSSVLYQWPVKQTIDKLRAAIAKAEGRQS